MLKLSWDWVSKAAQQTVKRGVGRGCGGVTTCVYASAVTVTRPFDKDISQNDECECEWEWEKGMGKSEC